MALYCSKMTIKYFIILFKVITLYILYLFPPYTGIFYNYWRSKPTFQWTHPDRKTNQNVLSSSR